VRPLAGGPADGDPLARLTVSPSSVVPP